MTNTFIRIIDNQRTGAIDFLDTEDAFKNKTVAAGQIADLRAVVPWATSENEFQARHMEVRDSATETTLFYIWQRTAESSNLVRVSTVGFEDPGNGIAGNATAGGKDRVLRVSGNISLDDLA